MSFVKGYLKEVAEIASLISTEEIESLADALLQLRRRGGRLFIIGVGGSAANASHAVNDFRKLANIDAIAPTDNVSEFSARANDEGWDWTFVGCMKASNFDKKDALLVLSVGGGDEEKSVSVNICRAVDYAISNSAEVYCITGRPNGYTQSFARCNVVIPETRKEHITPHSESFQAVIWHLLVSHPNLKTNSTKW